MVTALRETGAPATAVRVGSLLTLLLPKAPEIPAIKKMYGAVMTDGVLLANPALID